MLLFVYKYYIFVFNSTELVRMSSCAEVVDFTLFCVYWAVSTLSVLTESQNSASNAKHKSVFVCKFLHSQKHLTYITAMLPQTASFLWLSMWNFSDLYLVVRILVE